MVQGARRGAAVRRRTILRLWVLAVSFGVAEVFVMHIRIARHAQTFSLAEIPLAGLAFTTPGGLVLAQTVGVGIALAIHRRQKPLRLTFNVAQRACTTLLAVVFFAVCRSALPAGAVLWVSFFGATLLADLVGAMLINLAIGLSDDKIKLLDQVIGLGTSLTVANTALGIVGVMVFLQQPAAVLLVVAPAATTYLAGKAFTDLQGSTTISCSSSARGSRNGRSNARTWSRCSCITCARCSTPTSPSSSSGRKAVIGPPCAARSGRATKRSHSNPFPWIPRGVWARVASERESVLLSADPQRGAPALLRRPADPGRDRRARVVGRSAPRHPDGRRPTR